MAHIRVCHYCGQRFIVGPKSSARFERHMAMERRLVHKQHKEKSRGRKPADKYGLHLPQDYKPKGKKRMYDMKVP